MLIALGCFRPIHILLPLSFPSPRDVAAFASNGLHFVPKQFDVEWWGKDDMKTVPGHLGMRVSASKINLKFKIFIELFLCRCEQFKKATVKNS